MIRSISARITWSEAMLRSLLANGIINSDQASSASLNWTKIALNKIDFRCRRLSSQEAPDSLGFG